MVEVNRDTQILKTKINHNIQNNHHKIYHQYVKVQKNLLKIISSKTNQNKNIRRIKLYNNLYHCKIRDLLALFSLFSICATEKIRLVNDTMVTKKPAKTLV